MISKAIERAFTVKRERGYDTIYWAIDLHGTCLKSNYENGSYEFINEETIRALQKISDREDSKIILWSGCYPEEQQKIIKFFDDNMIKVAFFNENPLEASTTTGDFSKKFYFSILIDDKAGFDPYVDWRNVIDALYWETLNPIDYQVNWQ
jgi:hypothetical protein